jgi:hypothetical protein
MRTGGEALFEQIRRFLSFLPRDIWELPSSIDSNDADDRSGPASDKKARFAETFDAFHLPIVYFADVPGFMIGAEFESSGLIRRAARALQAVQRAEVPVLTVQIRRSYGLAGQATGNRKGHSIRRGWSSGLWGDMPVVGGVESE